MVECTISDSIQTLKLNLLINIKTEINSTHQCRPRTCPQVSVKYLQQSEPPEYEGGNMQTEYGLILNIPLGTSNQKQKPNVKILPQPLPC